MAKDVSQAALKLQAQRLAHDLDTNMDAMVEDPKMLKAYIEKNSKLRDGAKTAAVASAVAKNDVSMSSINKTLSKKLVSYVPMQPRTFMKELLKKYPSEGRGVDWIGFGRQASSYFREPPMAGCLHHLCVCSFPPPSPFPALTRACI